MQYFPSMWCKIASSRSKERLPWRRLVSLSLPTICVISRSISTDFINPNLKGISVLVMPQLSPSMHKGTITKWHADAGQECKSYDLLLEVAAQGLLDTNAGGSADEVQMEIEILEVGTICKILYNEGSVVPINVPIAVLCDEVQNIPYAQSLTMDTHSEVLLAAPRAMWQAYIKQYAPGEAGKCS